MVPSDDWGQIRQDERFIELMRLARVANSLALSVPPLLIPIDDQSPKARRDRFAGLMYSAALLNEGLRSSRTLGKWFRELPQYKDGLATIFSDPNVKVLEEKFLGPVRNEVAFHFDRNAIALGLSRLPLTARIICSYPEESGAEVGETYFDLADDAMLGYLFGAAETDEEYLTQLEGFMAGTSDLFKRFIIASHRLVAAGLLTLGCQKRKGARRLNDDDSITLE